MAMREWVAVRSDTKRAMHRLQFTRFWGLALHCPIGSCSSSPHGRINGQLALSAAFSDIEAIKSIAAGRLILLSLVSYIGIGTTANMFADRRDDS
jgi:hypothetical protein